MFTDFLVMGNYFIDNQVINLTSSLGFETYVLSFSNILRFCLFYSGKNQNKIESFNYYNLIENDIKVIMNNSALGDRLAEWIEDWQFSNTKIMKDKNKYKIKVSDVLLNSKIAQHRYVTAINAKLSRHVFEDLNNNKSEKDIYLDFDKEIEFIDLFLNIDDLRSITDEKYIFDLHDLAKSIFILKKMSYDFAQKKVKNPDLTKLETSDIIPELTFKQIYDGLKNEGIEHQKIESLIDLLTFKKNSESLFEYPLIKLEDDKYTYIPSILILTNTSNAIIRMMADKNMFSIKGAGYEKKFHRMIKESSFSDVVSIKEIVGKETYELDACFYNDGILYLCELKNWGFPYKSYEYYKFMSKIAEAVNQMKRICDYFSSDGINSICTKLKIDKSSVKEIKRLVVVSPYLGEKISINGIDVIDGVLTRNFFKQRYPNKVTTQGRNINNIITIPEFEDIKSKGLSNDAFLSFIEKNPHLKIEKKLSKRKFINVKELNLSLGYYDLQPSIKFKKVKK